MKDLPQVQIRRATERDIPVLREFEQGVIGAERPFDETLKPDPIRYYDLDFLMQAADSDVFVAESGNKAVGSAYVRILPAKAYLRHERYAYLGFMYVVPEYRGKGINRQIIEMLCSWANERGISEIRLDVYAANAPAIRAYEKAGFRKNLVEMRLDTNQENRGENSMPG